MPHHAPKPAPLPTPEAGEELSANERVYRTLRREIAMGKLPPGTRLVHRKLAQRMGTSTIPVIDALRRLEGAGLLLTTLGEGTQVRRWQPHEIEEIYLIRAANEAIACRLFAKRATDSELVQLEAYHEEYDAAVTAGDKAEAIAANERLHFHIVQGARSSELRRLVENAGFILLTIRNTMLPPALVASMGSGTVGFHEPLVRALQSRDPDAAEREGRTHVMRAAQMVLDLVGEYRVHHPGE